MKLQSKYCLAFFTLFFILSIALSFSSYFISKSIIINKYKELTKENLDYLLEMTDREMQQLSTTYSFIGFYEPLHHRIGRLYNEDETYQRMKDDLMVTNLFFSLSVDEAFDATSLIYIEGINGEKFWYSVDKTYFQQDKMDQLFKGLTIEPGQLKYMGVGKSLNRLEQTDEVLYFIRLLLDFNGNLLGKMYFELDADYFSKIFGRERLLTDTKLNLVDDKNRVLYSDEALEIGSVLTKESAEVIKVEGMLTSYPWKVTSETPESYIVDDSGEIIRRIIIMTGISLLLAIGVIIIMSSKFVKPIKKLIHAVSDVTEGDFNVSVNHISGDEIGELTQRFNMMTTRIQGHLEREIAHTKAMNYAEYKALQAQINPHFMYNSLNTLKWLASIQKAENIIKMVDALWILLKKTSNSDQMVTLANEMDVIQAFAIILQARYNGKFHMVYDVEEEHMKALIPKYILQPLVENAIFHGIAPKEGQGIVTIKSYRKEGDLFIDVSDDGVGIHEDRLQDMLEKGMHTAHKEGLNNIGIKNVNDRLLLLYGEAYHLLVKSEIHKGTTFTVKMPWSLDDPMREVEDA